MGVTARKIRLFFWVLIALFIAGIAISATFGVKRQGQGRVEPRAVDSGSLLSMDDVHYSGTRSGRVVWELDARKAYRMNGGGARLEAVRLRFFGKNERYTLMSKEGFYDDSGAAPSVTARGGVVVTSERGLELTASEMSYSTKTGMASAPGLVRIKTAEMDVTGHDMTADMESGVLKLARDVRAVFDGVSEGAAKGAER